MTGDSTEGMDAVDAADVLAVLAQGDLEIQGRIRQASNTTLFATATCDGVSVPCVYKPVTGERPLWDFPDGTLAGREVSAFLVSASTGWDLVPPTLLRDGPYGPGMVQRWIDIDPAVELVDVVSPRRVPPGWFSVVEALGERGNPVVLAHADDRRLRRMAVFDAVINNADRKGGHILATGPNPADPVYGVDHGVSFNLDDKLRTVLWGWAGDPVDDEEVSVLADLERALSGDLGRRLSEHLTRREVTVTRRRVANVLRRSSLPLPSPGWPAIPWPAF